MASATRTRISKFERSRQLSARAHDLIPAGCHTYSKGDDQFPLNAPGFLVRGEGVRVWDPDANEFIDWGMGLRSVILGHGYRRVLDAVIAQLQNGTNFTRPAPIEIELAELLVGLIPSAEMVKFAKNGSDVTSAAVRLARAYTGRDHVALCKDDPFFSFYDWFIGTTPANSGVPARVTELSHTFRYNDIASLEQVFAEHPGQIACVILEPVSSQAPQDGFLERVRDLAHERGALLIFDEIISGFRWHLRGAQAFYGVTPDLSTFGKAIGNGFSVSAVAGRRDVMELGGLRHSSPKVFLLSATHGAELHSLAAAIATISEMLDRDVVSHLWAIGRSLQNGFNALAKEMGLADQLVCYGAPCSPYISCRDREGAESAAFRTLFLQEMIANGVLIPWVAISYSHTEGDVDRTLEACRGAFEVYRRALEDGVDRHLVGPAVKPVFRKYN